MIWKIQNYKKIIFNLISIKLNIQILVGTPL